MNSFDKTSIIVALVACLSLLGIVRMATDYGIAVEQIKAQVEITKMQHMCIDS